MHGNYVARNCAFAGPNNFRYRAWTGSIQTEQTPVFRRAAEFAIPRVTSHRFTAKIRRRSFIFSRHVLFATWFHKVRPTQPALPRELEGCGRAAAAGITATQCRCWVQPSQAAILRSALQGKEERQDAQATRQSLQA